MSETISTIDVVTQEGPVRGKVEAGVAIFQGVPFAAAPIGALRFQPPVPPLARAEVLDATSPAPICPQRPSRVFYAMGEQGGTQNEDCLTAAIWAPTSLDRKRPVIVWIHGGALSSGAGAVPWYDGAKLARENDIVVVALNYRLGALGFLCGAGLAEGNMGFLDQIRALEWISENISSFGGDARQVTLMGQSAGAVTITYMLALPKVRQLFQRIILLSGGTVVGQFQTATAAAAVSSAFCAALDIDPSSPTALEQLQSLPVSRILEAELAVLSGSSKDVGDVMPTFSLAAATGLFPGEEFESAVREGARGIDALIGTTAEEMRLFEGLDPRTSQLGFEDLPVVASRLFGESAPSLLAQAQRARPGASPPRVLADAYTHSFVQGIRQVALAVAEGEGRAWLFRFDWSAPASEFGACHCVDLPFIFGNFDAFAGAPMLAGGNRADMEALSSVMRSAIARFARSGSPAGDDIPEWPAFSRSQSFLMVFDSLIDLASIDASQL